MIWILIYSNRMDRYENNKIKEYIIKKNKDNFLLLDPNKISVILDGEKANYYYEDKEINKPQKVYIKTGCMINDHTEDIIKTLDEVKVINEVDLIKLASNKFLTNNILRKNEIEYIKSLKLISSIDKIEEQIKNFNFPLIIKSKIGSLGGGIFLVKQKEELKNIIETQRYLDKNYQYMIQEYIEEASVDYRVVVYGGKISYILKREAQKGEFRANFTLGSKVSISETNKEIEKIVKKIYKTIPLNVMGIDLIKRKKKYIVCEINSNPGFKGIDSLGEDHVEEFINYLEKC